jgi:nuclear transport factor 2 (NTF2) superfamily protein
MIYQNLAGTACITIHDITKGSIIPPFNEETARMKVKNAQDAWNTKDPELVAQAYATDFQWRNRT